ncbi:MAG: uracil-DNA glycosylase [Desulfobacula sp.]|nr:uracil-DNA glycosylase [Desulfobacula sp.]
MSANQSEISESGTREPGTKGSISPDFIKSEFKQIIQDFEQYLTAQKKIGNTGVLISSDSKKNMDSWGALPEPSEPFLFEGSQPAGIFIIDSQGRFFKSEGGLLLKKILRAINLTPDQVFICNAVSLEHIKQKVNITSPKVIITLGQSAAQLILGLDKPLAQIRGRFYEFMGVKMMPTFHPDLLIKQPEFKRQVWEDMKQVMAYAGLRNGS